MDYYLQVKKFYKTSGVYESVHTEVLYDSKITDARKKALSLLKKNKIDSGYVSISEGKFAKDRFGAPTHADRFILYNKMKYLGDATTVEGRQFKGIWMKADSFKGYAIKSDGSIMALPDDTKKTAKRRA